MHEGPLLEGCSVALKKTHIFKDPMMEQRCLFSTLQQYIEEEAQFTKDEKEKKSNEGVSTQVLK